ncbi:LolA-like protein [Actinomadura rubrobrunea]|nr:hypothetical protein [Actinomadura rubrobrunea]
MHGTGEPPVVPPEPGDVLVAGRGMQSTEPVAMEPPAGGPAPAPPPQQRQEAPKKEKKSRAWLAVGAVAAVVVLAGGAVAFALRSDGDGRDAERERKADPPVASWALEAGRDLQAVPGLQYEGTLRGTGAQAVRMRLKMTRSGAATGRLVVGARQYDMVAVGDATYVKADVAFWRQYGSDTAHPENYADRWSKTPKAMPGFDVAKVLAPEAIAEALTKAKGGTSTENVGGTPAYRVKTAKAHYFFSAAAPHRLLRVQVAGKGDPSLTVAKLTRLAPVFAELRPRVAALVGAADPTVRFRAGRLSFINCNENVSGCTVSVPATLTVPEDGPVPDGTRAQLRAAITAEGRLLGTCTGSGLVPANRSLVLRCTVRSPAWRAWMRQARDTPGEHAYEAQARVVGQALTAADVAKLLARLDRERAALAPSRSRSPAPKTSVAVSPARP